MSDIGFKEIFNDWLGINTAEPRSKQVSEIFSVSIAPDSLKLVVCIFFKFREDNGYNRQQVKGIVSEFLKNQNQSRECHFIWTAAVPLYKEYFLGGLSFKKDTNGKLFCQEEFVNELSENKCNQAELQQEFNDAKALLNYCKEHFINDEDACKKYIEDYYEQEKMLPPYEKLQDQYEWLTTKHKRYYTILEKCNIADKYVDALKNLAGNQVNAAGESTLERKKTLNDYFSKSQLKTLNIEIK